MLDSLRTHAKGWLGKFIVIGISLTFALFGLQSYTASSGSEKPLATVGDKNIYQGELNNAYQQQLAQLQDQYGEQFQPEMINEQALRMEVLNRLVQENLVLHAVESEGYEVSESTVLQEVAKVKTFQKDGVFDKKTYQRLLSNNGMSSEGFIERVKQGLERDQFINGVAKTTFVDDGQVNNFYRLNMQTRDIRLLSLPLSSVVSGIEVDDKAIEDYYQQNSYLYQTDESVSIDYVELKMADILADITPSEDELRAFYESEKESFSTAAKRRASHILFEAPEGSSSELLAAKRAQAEAILARVKAGEDFSVLATEFSDDIGSAKSGGDLGYLSEGIMGAAFEESLNALVEGGVSDLVVTPFGYHIIKLSELSEASIKDYQSVKVEVTEAYKKEIAEEKFFQLAEQLNELAFEVPDSLDALEDQLGLAKQTLDTFSRGSAVGIAENRAVLEAAFSADLLAGNNSEPLEISPEHLVVLHLKEYQPASVKVLADVRGSVELAVKTKMARVAHKLNSDILLERLLNGEELKGIAKDLALDIDDIGPVTRNERSVQAEIMQDAFSMSRPTDGVAGFKSSLLNNGDIALIELTKVVDGDIADMSVEESDSIQQFINRLEAEVLLTSTLATLAKETGVSISSPQAQ